jgi:hypothetical protein
MIYLGIAVEPVVAELISLTFVLPHVAGEDEGGGLFPRRRYRRNRRSMQRVLRFLTVKIESFNDGNIVYGK